MRVGQQTSVQGQPAQTGLMAERPSRVHMYIYMYFHIVSVKNLYNMCELAYVGHKGHMMLNIQPFRRKLNEIEDLRCALFSLWVTAHKCTKNVQINACQL